MTTVASSLRYLLAPQLAAVVEAGGEVLAVSAPGADTAAIEALGVRHIPLPSSTRGWNLRSDLAAACELWRILRRERPTILHTHNPKPGVYGRVIGRLARVPVVVNTVHGLYATPDDPLARRVAVYGLEAVASRFSDLEFVQNEEDLALMARRHLAARSKLRLLGNGVDLTRFDPAAVAGRADPDRRRALRASIGAGDDTVVVGTVGRLVAEKGYPELFEAFASLGSLDTRLVVIGPDDPDKPDALDPSVITRAIAAGVRLLGQRDDVADWYGAMDVFVLASHREGLPRAAMEAAAMGLPIVATDIRGCRQVVVDGVNGILVPALDPDRLAAALRRLIDDGALRARLGAASRARAVEHFDERAVVAKVLDGYAEAAGRRRIDLRPNPARVPARTTREAGG